MFIKDIWEVFPLFSILSIVSIPYSFNLELFECFIIACIGWMLSSPNLAKESIADLFNLKDLEFLPMAVNNLMRLSSDRIDPL